MRPTSPSSVAREQQRLALARGHLHDSVDDRAEAHVEHPVGLVEDEQPDAAERHVAAVDQVEQPSRRRDEDVRARGEPRLLDDPGAAVHGGDRERACVGDRAQVIDDLDCQLARGREHERGRAAASRVLQALDHRHPEGERLARPVGDWASTSWPASTSGMTMLCTANGAVDPALGELVRRRPRTRRGRRKFHASCVGAPSGGPLAAAADGDSTDPIRAQKRQQRQRTSRTTSPPVGNRSSPCGPTAGSPSRA